MPKKESSVKLDRRKFLAAAAVAGASGAVAPAKAMTASAPEVQQRLPSALPPNAYVAANETGTPQLPEAEGGRPGSDFMVDVIKTLDIKYLPANPAASYRGLHESIIDYGKNTMPEFLTCMHEESAVGMCHGYFKATGKPIMLLVIGGNDLDAAHRPPLVPTFHSAQDINAIVRDYTKWDDTPVSAEHFAQSFVRMYKIATTPPYGPVMMSLDGGLQNEPSRERGEPLYIPKFFAAAPPQGDDAAVKEAARLLANAEHPVIVVDRAARTADGVKLLVELAELLQAPVVDQGGRMNFPNTHPLSRPATVIGQADVVIGMELSDYWGTVNGFWDNGNNGFGQNIPKLKPGTKLISISSVDLLTKSNYQDFQRFQSIDISMPGDAEATLPSLIDAVKSAISSDRKDAMTKRGDAIRQAHAKGLADTKQAAAVAWDASPISTARMVMELYAQIKDLDFSLVSSSGNVSGWPNRLWRMEKHHSHLGGPGGYGVGYGSPAAVGGALGNRDIGGRFSVNIQGDGDFMYAPGVLWTAARHKIPILSVMHNNRGYHQEVMHVQRLANRRNRVASLGMDRSPIGTSIETPDIDYASLAKSMGYWSAGPIKDPAQLGPTIKRAVEVVKAGQPVLVDVWTQPR